MKKDVLVTIKGMQSMGMGEEPEEVEMVAKGNYYLRNGHHFILYDEMMEGFNDVTKNSIKITKNAIEVQKKGVTNVHMVFEENKKTVTYYATPFGNMEMGISTTGIRVKEEEEKIDIQIDYALDINEEHAADCQIFINVQPKDIQGFSLLK